MVAHSHRVKRRCAFLCSLLLLTAAPQAAAGIITVTDPVGDDHGPGNYAYPTSSNFHSGAFDLTNFQIFDDGTTIYFLVQTADLTPTFGSPLGAQLIDVYLHDPLAAVTSTAASFPQRNYTIASADA